MTSYSASVCVLLDDYGGADMGICCWGDDRIPGALGSMTEMPFLGD